MLVESLPNNVFLYFCSSFWPCDVLATPTHRVGFQDVPGRQQGRGYCALDALRLAGFTIDTQFFQNVARCQALAVKFQTGGDMDRGQLRWN